MAKALSTELSSSWGSPSACRVSLYCTRTLKSVHDMGSSFVPNHIGMPLVSPKLKLDFLRRQVLMSRNISGGPPMSIFMGGLKYQIEHHLFPQRR
jgi:Fatty acid desaturase